MIRLPDSPLTMPFLTLTSMVSNDTEKPEPKTSLPLRRCIQSLSLLLILLVSVALSAPIAFPQQFDFSDHCSLIGHVSLPDGKPAVGFRVEARFKYNQTGRTGEGSVFTDHEGNYSMQHLATAEFVVLVDTREKGFLPPKFQAITLTNQASGVNFTLQQGPLITIRVHDAETGEPLPGLHFAVFDFGLLISRFTTDAKGEAIFRASSLNQEMELQMTEEQQHTRSIGPAPGSFFNRSLRMKQPEDVDWNILTYSYPGGYAPRQFKGKVVDTNGHPVPNVLVRLVGKENDPVLTDKAGKFEISSYRMTQQQQQHSVLLRADKSNRGTVKYVQASETWGEIVIRLPRESKPSLYGVVVSPQGKPVPDVPVTLYERYKDSSAYTVWDSVLRAVTDSRGRFRITGLSSFGLYQLRFCGMTGYALARQDYIPVLYPKSALKKDWLNVAAGKQLNIGRIIVVSQNEPTQKFDPVEKR